MWDLCFGVSLSCTCWAAKQCYLLQVRTAWKVWRTWSNGGGETGLRFDDSVVQNQLAPGLVQQEKVTLHISSFDPAWQPRQPHQHTLVCACNMYFHGRVLFTKHATSHTFKFFNMSWPCMIMLILHKYMQPVYIDEALPCGLQVGHELMLICCANSSYESDVAVQGDVVLTFTPEATGVSWPAYVDLYCAGAKQLFFHEKPKVQLQLEPVPMSSL